ncbi:hypothetical protein MTO96_039613, partial [Rhipicephalus appendiculatus]
MANFVMPLTNLTTKQYELMVNARSRYGAHAFYYEGFNSQKKQFKLYFPSTFGAKFAFTVVFQYDGPSTDVNSLTLAHETKPTETYLTLGFSDTYSLEYYRDKQQRTLPLNNIKAPPKGLHILEFHTELSRLMGTLDGQQIFPSASVYRETDPMRIFYSGPTAGSNFVFWESHFAATDYFVEFNPTLEFKHENVSITNGGYVFIQARWPRDIDIKVPIQAGSISLMKTFRSVGDTGILIKMYGNGFATGYANTTGGIMDYTLKSIPLDGIHVEPLPISVVDFTV